MYFEKGFPQRLSNESWPIEKKESFAIHKYSTRFGRNGVNEQLGLRSRKH